MTSPPPPLVEGPRWYRARLRSFGPLVALLPPAALGGVALIALGFGDSRITGLIGLFTGVIAAPGLLVAGAPLGEESWYPIGVAASVPLWLIVGWIASRRATRSPMATWREFWREYLWLACGIVVGAVGALVAATMILGEAIY